jgi:hypothetical protein
VWSILAVVIIQSWPRAFSLAKLVLAREIVRISLILRNRTAMKQVNYGGNPMGLVDA